MEVNEIVSSARNVYSQDQYAMYLRKSRADLELEALGEGETLVRHMHMLEALAARHNISTNQITVYKEIVSGESLSERPEAQKLLKDVYSKKYKGVLVVEVERLARGNTKDQGEVADAFQYSGTHIITPAKVYDPNNEFDQEYFEFGLFMSRREYKTIRRRMDAGKDQSVQEGNFIGTWAPYGFDAVRISKKERILVENPEKSEIVKMIFDWFTEDRLTPGRIASKLSNMGIKSPGGKTNWHRSSVIDILKNPHYIGNVRWKNREMRKEFIDGQLVKTCRRNKGEQVQVYEGKHNGFISEEQFNKAQTLFGDSIPSPFSAEIINPFVGLLVCASCGKTIRYNALKSRPKSTPRFEHYKVVDCGKISLPADQVVDAIIDALAKHIKDFEVKKKNDHNKDEWIRYQKMIEAMETELAKQERKRARLFDDYEDDVYTKDEFIERKQVYNQTIEELKKQIQIAKKANPEPVNYDEQIENVSAIIKCIKDPDISAKEKNVFMKQFIDRITYDAVDHGRNKGGVAIIEIFLK